MSRFRKIILLFALTLIMAILAIMTEKLYFSDYEYYLRTRYFNKILAEKEATMESCLHSMEIAEKNNIIIFEYYDDMLVYWSDNNFDVPLQFSDTLYNKPLVFFQNGWFLSKTVRSGNELIVALLRVRTEYGFTNDIIRNGFEKEFRLSENVNFSFDKEASVYHILDKNGNFLFSLLFPSGKEMSFLTLVPLSFWLLTFIFLIWLIIEFAGRLTYARNKILSTIILSVFFSLLYTLFLLIKQPKVLFLTGLFSPYRFALSSFMPSLGHLLILSIFAALTAVIFFRNFPDFVKGKRAAFVIKILYSLAAAASFALFHFLFCQLISTSNINFEPYKVLELSWHSIVGFIALLLFLLIPYFIILKTFKLNSLSGVLKLVIISVIAVPIFYVFFSRNPGNFFPLILFWVVFVAAVWIAVKYNYKRFNTAVMLAFVTGLYSLYFITILSQEKTTENIKIQAVTFSAENDPDAEYLLLDIWPVISSDEVLRNMMLSERFNTNREDYDRILTYLSETYFKEFLENYYFDIVLCSNRQVLQVASNEPFLENCFVFFDLKIQLDGQRLTGTEFYFIDNQNGRTTYFGNLFYETGREITNGLFIFLHSDINIFQPGYTELLLDKKYNKYTDVKDYSLAKYINGEVVLRTGDFVYNKTDTEYVNQFTGYRLFNAEGYDHVLYRSGNSTVIISRPEIKPGDLIVSFAYLFAFILIFLNMVILPMRMPSFKKLKSLNFRQKLQLSYITILLFSFVMIGIIVSTLTIREYENKHNDNIREKLNSIYYELEQWLGNENQLSTDWHSAAYSSLNGLFINMSNIFNTDINMYDLNGYLIATSRQEIFNRNLISQRINNVAFTKMRDFTQSEYFQKEKIGKLEYISAYIPFYNDNNKMLAYLNLPYFRMQSVLAKEVSNLVAVIINFTFLLVVIAMGFSVFISGRLTAPLALLSEKLASVGVGRKSEYLSYESDDEIGDLVKKYNKMVGEIEESAKKLAFSEREYAWREMAKQIAHEIKNPLTPMKLNVQQLLKSWRDSAQGFDARIESFSKNQIEYIDNMSTIATAFSSFAKMPGNNPSDVNLLGQIHTSLELYKNTGNITFNVNWEEKSKIIIYADKEQLNGVFSNLIKNAIQSIPTGKAGVIEIGVEIKKNRAIVKIADNGTGIPDDLKQKMFILNFTTKSSGMGLGLSIAKRYVENAGGKIWFESQDNIGTTFFIDFPIKYIAENRDDAHGVSV